MGPLNELLCSENWCAWRMLPSSDGTGPWSLLDDTKNDSIMVRLPSSDGSMPENLFLYAKLHVGGLREIQSGR